MPYFAYRAVDAEGTPSCGARRGESADDVRQALRAEGLRASSIRRRDEPGAGGLLRRGVTGEDLAFLHRQTANLLAAGLPLPRALRAVARESRKRELQALADAVAAEVDRGRPLSDALRDLPRAVPPFLADLIKAGEAGGNLPAVLLQIAESGEAEAHIHRTLRTALIYPLMVTSIALAIVILNVSGLMGDMSFKVLGGEELPLFRVAFQKHLVMPWFVNLLTHPILWGAVMIAFLACAGYVAPILSLRGSRTGIPVFGPLVQQVLVSRFCRVLGLLAERGVPLPTSLRLAGAASDSARLAAQAESAAADLESGRPIDEAIDRLRLLPAVSRWGMTAAAARGALAEELQALARQADGAAADAGRRFAIVMEMGLIIVIGLFVLLGAGGSILRTLARMIPLSVID
jgi:general secretion pathway protein F